MPLSFMYSLEEETYIFDVTCLLKALLQSLNQICYVSFNKTGDSINQFCKDNGIDPAKIAIVDMISPRLKECQNYDNIIFVDMDKMDAAKEIIHVMEEKKCDAFILDSLSTMNIYYDEKQLLKFSHELLVYTESKHLISNIIIQRHDEKKEWLRSIIPLVGTPKSVNFSK